MPLKQTVLPRLLTIDPGTAFLPTLARALAEGEIFDDFHWDGDPLVLADATIYVPTRRAARELRAAFVDLTGVSSCLMPTIRPLGEFDDDLDLFDPAGDALDLPLAIAPMTRQLLLGRLVLAWTRHLEDGQRKRLGDETITTPVSTSDAFWLGGDLGALLDQMQTEGKTLRQAADAISAAEDNVSKWWGITMAFLQIVETEWPNMLAERNRIDPATHRNLALEREARRLEAQRPNAPILVAGSTGSVPATGRLMHAIARLPRGAVVLPGYDLTMDDDLRALLDAENAEAPTHSHPQFGLHRTVAQIGGAPSLIARLGPPLPEALAQRRLWVNQALRPAQATQGWLAARRTIDGSAFDAVTLLEAPTDAALAAAIAVSLRQAIREPDRTAALITPDRNLARRVSIELARHGIQADDSAGFPFGQSPHGVVLDLLLRVVFDEPGPASLLALVKHPLVRLGQTAEAASRDARLFEHVVLRGGRGRVRCGALEAFAQAQLQALAEDGARQPMWMRRHGADACVRALGVAQRLDAACAPLCRLRDTAGPTTLEACVEATIRCLEHLASDADGRFEPLYADDAGHSLETFLRSLIEADADITFDADQWPNIVASLTANRAIRPTMASHPRVHIWGTLEARLQHVDHAILGGLNDGVWPQVPSNDAFVTRSQKNAIGMQPPEQRVGLSAHDFQMAMGHPSVVLARALRNGGEPSVASRWWQRLTALAGPDTTGKMKARGDALLTLSAAVNAPVDMEPIVRPAPCPPVAMRPKRLSVTEIDTLIRDPYAVYAKHVLSLRPVEELVHDPDNADRGRLFHAVLERAVTDGIDFAHMDARAMLAQTADAVFADAGLPAAIEMLWRPRFDATMDAFIDWERGRMDRVTQRHAEQRSFPVAVDDTGVSLTGQADRLDVMADGCVDIIDYKTGQVPSEKAVKAVLAPQLPLEAALLRRGGFAAPGRRTGGQLAYIKLGPRGQFEAKPVVDTELPNGDDLGELAWEKLVDLLAAYGQPSQPYVSQVRPAKGQTYAGHYDHLARISEWGAEDDGDDHGA